MFPRLASLLILGLCSTGALAADATYRPAFQPDQLKGPPAGRPNEVLVLGTAHLSGLPKSFQPALLEPLLQRLVTWKPELIATEDLSGLQCDFMRRYPARYAESVATYCFDTTAAQAATGLTCLQRTPRPSACLRHGRTSRRPPSVVDSLHCSWQRANAARRRCSGCACLRPSAKTVMD